MIVNVDKLLAHINGWMNKNNNPWEYGLIIKKKYILFLKPNFRSFISWAGPFIIFCS